MKLFDQLAVQDDDTAALLHGGCMSLDDIVSLGQIRLRRRKNFVRLRDRFGVDQSLAVEAEGARLATLLGETLRVIEIKMHAIEDGETMGAGRQDAERQGSQQRLPPRRVESAQILYQIRGAHHETGETRRGSGNLRRFEDAERRLYHGHECQLFR